MTVAYALEPSLSVDEFVDVLERSGLAERRPVQDRARIAEMLANADVVATARTSDGVLVGVARAISDFAYACYLSDLAVDRAHQRRGVGRGLLALVRESAGGERVAVVLVAAPAADGYYERVGLERISAAFVARRSQ